MFKCPRCSDENIKIILHGSFCTFDHGRLYYNYDNSTDPNESTNIQAECNNCFYTNHLVDFVCLDDISSTK